ncbi:hypothetical protein DICPUDRAFT_153372 [Dictyostelium purpureum]|uniref:Splicing factor 3A subunit 1 n=1 Tax=Dictyostelium purpureum TaxID=5786 RepID=F0ZNQ8_DICPU|nr:uncharacterized protein DICPUDRAFT_153372 [Dictyostelium purpureum]EGC34429.1 hypothetical protein DICPUDRAFT_153372 [Dictyostelium purpureum]|eukprot:XP_003289058.1 hypothetical protein DICPUDRAFT_153372 [Dictyostelium purpureum]
MVSEIITPEGDLKNIIDKTAQYAAKLGESFETKVRNKEGHNPKFNFMKEGDIHYSYYRNKINENKDALAKAAAPAPTTAKPAQATSTTPAVAPQPNTDTASAAIPNIAPVPTVSPHQPNIAPVPILMPHQQPPQQQSPPPPPPKKEPTLPDPLLYILDVPDFMTPLELDTIRLTAQFIAKNGESFYNELLNRESKNNQFDFLKPTNHLYEWFRALVESYSDVIYPPANIKEKLQTPEFTDKQVILERSMNRFEYNQKIELEKQKAEEKEDEEKSMIASIDWHDFVIVDTIEFNEEDLEDLPPPKTFEQLLNGDILGVEEDQNDNQDVEMDVEMDMGEDDMDQDEQPEQPEQSSSNKVDQSKLKIVKDYQKTVSKPQNQPKRTQICHFCKQEIPLDEMQEHMRIELIQKQQRDKSGGSQGGVMMNTLTQDEDIARNLQSFASKRSDIFGEVDGSKRPQEPQDQPQKIIWDGHSGSIPKVQAAMMAASQQKQQQHQQQTPQPKPPQHATIPHQPHHHLQQPQMQLPPQSLLPHLQQQPIVPPGVGMPPNMVPPPFGIPGMMPPPPFGIPGMMPPPPPSNMILEEPNSKKVKKDENLIPEQIFLQANPGPVTLNIESPEKTFQLTVHPTDLISTLKEKIKDINGMATNKQKLQAAGLSVLKDTCTIAYYNLKSNSTINLSVKERGGKKK